MDKADEAVDADERRDNMAEDVRKILRERFRTDVVLLLLDFLILYY